MKFMLPAAAAAAALLAAPAPASAQADEPKINQLIVYGDDPCPQSTDDEIIVCARKSEDERFRIPKGLRGNPNDPVNQAWGARAMELQYVGRSGIGSCSTTGPGGMIGCYNDLVRRARAERAGADDVNWNALIEKARQERLARIDEAQAEEEEANRPR
jgi:hypothetical protein